MAAVKVTNEEREQEILNVLHSYAWSYDSNDMKQLALIFEESGVTVGSVAGSDTGWGPWVGPSEIARKLGEIRASQSDRRRHQLTTPVFLELSDAKALVKIYLSLFSTPAGGRPRLVTTGQYTAALSKSDDGWKIGRLEAQLDGGF
ncbi:nuclear transport factor 2 family protein [Variovorax sp. J31P207]|uniref:nuclear transport factor 2 family protein n=1 Tax=Variovorax sp. J31P207 TaxID=3053510 RepID=UPI0025785759|nr:nuclear transport factor 2 family protein [Variovorax sp. J31P207]MDM0071534.1 nuclear transport factor 2 family protein [Variovorax sp. J31P207]